MLLKCEFPFEGGCKEEATRVLFTPDYAVQLVENDQYPLVGQPLCGDHLPEMVHEARSSGEETIWVADITNSEKVPT